MKAAGGTIRRLSQFRAASLSLQFRGWRLLSCTIIGAQRFNYLLKLSLKFCVVTFPAGEVGCQARSDLLGFSALPVIAEQMAVEIERNERQRLRSALFHQPTLFLKSGVNLIVYPPACERMF